MGSGAYGAHLTFWRQRILGQTAMVVPSPPFSLRARGLKWSRCRRSRCGAAALDARKAFVRTLSDGQRALLEESLARHLTSLCAEAEGRRRLCALGFGNQPAAGDGGSASGRARSSPFPAFDHPAKPFRFRAGDPLEAGPFGIMQPKPRTPVVEPDLILVPLIAIDGRGHTARPRQGPLRSRACPPEEERGAAGRRGLGLAAPRGDHSRRRMGYPARCLRLA